MTWKMAKWLHIDYEVRLQSKYATLENIRPRTLPFLHFP